MPWLLPLVLAASAMLLVAVYLRRLTLIPLVGPVFFYDLLRLSRRGRFLALRVGYAGVLLVLVLLAYRDWTAHYATDPGEGFFSPVRVPLTDMPKLAEALFAMLLSAQFVAVFLITPVYMAGAIADEKDRRTLEILFASGLTSREIVLGKLAARLGHVLAVILAGLPVLVLLPFWGGVDPNLVIAGFLATAMAAVSLASFGVWASIRTNRPIDAILLTYAVAFAYMLLSPCVPGLDAWFVFSTFFGMSSRQYDVWQIVARLLIFIGVHGMVAAAFAASAIHRLRRIGFDDDPKEESWRKSSFEPPPIVYYRPRPRAPIRPLRLALWKERFVERSFLEDHPVVTGILAMAFLAAGVPFVTITLSLLINGTAHEANRILRPILVLLAAPAPLLVGLSAAWRITRERERGTLDGLLCTAMEWRYWMLAKVLVPFRNVSFLMAAAGLVCGLGMLRGGFNVVTIPFLVAAQAVHLGFAAMLGLFLSARSTSTVRAMIVTLLLLLGLGIVPLFLGPAEILSAPVAIWELSVGYEYDLGDIPRILGTFALTMAVYGGATWLLWRGTLRGLHG